MLQTHKISYDLSKFNFVQLILDHFGVRDLSQIHKWLKAEIPLYKDKAGDQSSDIHKHFYKIYDKDSSFLDLYRNFIAENIQPKLNEPVVYQTRPTFRVHLPNNVAVGEWHKDKHYGHQKAEVNYWLPFTNAFGNNTIWIESQEDLGDYRAYDVALGECLVFNGVGLKHGNQVNDTGVSRVSMDFRVMPLSAYDPAATTKSSHLNLSFTIGGYFSLLK